MNAQLLKYLEQMLDIEEQGAIEEAIMLADAILKAFPAEKAGILLEKAKLEFRNGYDKKALLDFISAYECSGDTEVYELILEAYYLPNQEELQENFRKNNVLLEKYPHYRNDYKGEAPTVFPVWQDEEHILYVDQENKVFDIVVKQQLIYKELENAIVLMENPLWINDIVECEKSSRISERFLDMDRPMYLVFERNIWELFLQLYELGELLKANRIVFLIGEEAFKSYFSEYMVFFPDAVFGADNNQKYITILKNLYDELTVENKKNLALIEKYYETNEEQILERIKSGHPRILFLTSRFTTVLQYHTRDCMQAAQKAGCEVKMLIEKDDISRLGVHEIIGTITEFQPDIVFVLDHFRFEDVYIPKQLVWITWVQDPMPHIMDKDTPAKLGNRDFVLSHFTTWGKFKQVGYSRECLIDAPIPANANIYRPYELNEEECKAYACDICFVCHASDVDSHIKKILEHFPEEEQEMLYAVYKGYQEYVYETGQLFYEESVFAQYIEGTLKQCYGRKMNNQIIQYLANDMCMGFNQRVFRQALVDWILDAGFRNIKLWGNGWKDSTRYKDYAMGPAQNGETLSKIYQASKIVIGNNIMTTAAARAWETMLSGGFYMSNYIPRESDVTDIREILEVDKDVVMFYDKEDLIYKLHYYLEHEEERKQMIERGRKAALEKMTFDILMEKTLQEVAKRLEAREDER